MKPLCTTEDQILQKLTWTELCAYLNSINWLNLFNNCISAFCMWDTFIDIVMTGVSMHVAYHSIELLGMSGGVRITLCELENYFVIRGSAGVFTKPFPTANLYDKYKRASKGVVVLLKTINYLLRRN